MLVTKYFTRTNYNLVSTKNFSIRLYGDLDIYKEGSKLTLDNLTKPRHISFDKILRADNSLRTMVVDNNLVLNIYTHSNKERVLKRIGTDRIGNPVLKFNDVWLRMSQELFNKIGLNYLHSLSKTYNELININLDDYRLVLHKTRFGYPDITIYEGEQEYEAIN